MLLIKKACMCSCWLAIVTTQNSSVGACDQCQRKIPARYIDDVIMILGKSIRWSVDLHPFFYWHYIISAWSTNCITIIVLSFYDKLNFWREPHFHIFPYLLLKVFSFKKIEFNPDFFNNRSFEPLFFEVFAYSLEFSVRLVFKK